MNRREGVVRDRDEGSQLMMKKRGRMRRERVERRARPLQGEPHLFLSGIAGRVWRGGGWGRLPPPKIEQSRVSGFQLEGPDVVREQKNRWIKFVTSSSVRGRVHMDWKKVGSNLLQEQSRSGAVTCASHDLTSYRLCASRDSLECFGWSSFALFDER